MTRKHSLCKGGGTIAMPLAAMVGELSKQKIKAIRFLGWLNKRRIKDTWVKVVKKFDSLGPLFFIIVGKHGGSYKHSPEGLLLLEFLDCWRQKEEGLYSAVIPSYIPTGEM